MRTINIALLREVGSLSEPSEQTPGPYSASTRLRIILDPALADSIREQYVNELNPGIYRELSRPMSRTLYRLLSEYQLNNANKQLGLNLQQLSQLLGYPEGHRISNVQRDLTPAHTELLNTGYLKEVVYTGRGKSCTVHYTFGGAAEVFSSVYTEMLTSRGISKGAAIPILISYSEEEIAAACRRFDELTQSGYSVRNRGGLMSDLIRHPAKYQVQTVEQPVQTSSIKFTHVPEHEADLEPDETARARTFKNLLSKKVALHFSEQHQDLIKSLYLEGHLDAAKVQQLCASADPIADLSTLTEHMVD